MLLQSGSFHRLLRVSNALMLEKDDDYPGKMFSLLYNDSVLALKLDLVFARNSLFCNLWIMEPLNPHDKTPKCKSGGIRLLHIFFQIISGKEMFQFVENANNLIIIY